MSEQYKGQLAEVSMTETWKQWQGQTVNGEFCLGDCLLSSEHSATFLTEHGNAQVAAIKLAVVGSPNAERQFESWKLAETLSHPNLIRVFKTGNCEFNGVRLLYAVMENADEDLSQILPQRALTEGEAREMLKPVLDALAYLRGKGLVHGRIRPTDIMAIGNQVKLSADGLRHPGQPIDGPDDFDPPEGVYSREGEVWSLAIVLVGALAQRLPTWDFHGQGDPEVPNTLPPVLGDIVRHSLRRDPNQRWLLDEIVSRLNSATTARTDTTQRLQGEQRVAGMPETARHAGAPMSRFFAPTIILFVALGVVAGVKLWHPAAKSNPEIVSSKQRLAQAESVDGQLAPQAIQGAAKSATPNQVTGQTQATNATNAKTSEEPPSTLDSKRASTSDALEPAESKARPKKPAANDSTENSAKFSRPPASGSDVIHQVLPEVPRRAQETIHGTVRVNILVNVDSSGEPSGATIESAGPSKYFANLALKSAQQWKFAPDAPGTWMLRFEFKSEGVRASAERQ